MKSKFLLLTLTLAAISASIAGAALPPLPNISINADIRLGRRTPPPPPAVVVVTAQTGPRDWERRSWRYRSESYMYYPGYDVYYRPSDRMWFYSDRGQWRSNRNLPDGIRIDFNRSVTLTMSTDRPYQYHQQVVNSYPSNYFGTRVRLRDNDHDGRDSDGDGRDKDRDYNRRGNDDSRRGNDHDGRDSDGDGRDKDRGNRK